MLSAESRNLTASPGLQAWEQAIYPRKIYKHLPTQAVNGESCQHHSREYLDEGSGMVYTHWPRVIGKVRN